MKGIYCLIINVKKIIELKIGALGKIKFKKGTYVYVGSAQNNLKKRVKRHLSENKKLKWHIDYLLKNKNVKIEKTIYKKAGKKEECKTACLFSKFDRLIKNFGSSDCSCCSHLFRLTSLKSLNNLKFEQLKCQQ
jgi:Uri superfamily endonuclease|tara:strand:- start:1182 stop:1583 length:402 start_codon:yes stop_codon:yes gene_type:complete